MKFYLLIGGIITVIVAIVIYRKYKADKKFDELETHSLYDENDTKPNPFNVKGNPSKKNPFDVEGDPTKERRGDNPFDVKGNPSRRRNPFDQ